LIDLAGIDGSENESGTRRKIGVKRWTSSVPCLRQDFTSFESSRVFCARGLRGSACCSMITAMPHLRAVIFDFDGLIVDTESTGYQTWREIFESHGLDLAVETYAAVIGTDFGAHYDPRVDLEERTGRTFDWADLEAQRTVREKELRKDLSILPGVVQRLEEAAALGLPCAIASSSPRWWVEGWLNDLGLMEHFHHLTTVDDTGKVKPDPSLFLLAAERLGVATDEAVIFEDSLNGLNAALAAGIRCVVAPGPMTRHLDFEGAWRRVDSLQEVTLNELRSILSSTL
jgi:putative hydrolase of the HAD superfamily